MHCIHRKQLHFQQASKTVITEHLHNNSVKLTLKQWWSDHINLWYVRVELNGAMYCIYGIQFLCTESSLRRCVRRKPASTYDHPVSADKDCMRQIFRQCPITNPAIQCHRQTPASCHMTTCLTDTNSPRNNCNNNNNNNTYPISNTS